MGKLGISKVSHGITNLIPTTRAEREREREQVRFVSLERDYVDYAAADSYFDLGGPGRNLEDGRE